MVTGNYCSVMWLSTGALSIGVLSLATTKLIPFEGGSISLLHVSVFLALCAGPLKHTYRQLMNYSDKVMTLLLLTVPEQLLRKVEVKL